MKTRTVAVAVAFVAGAVAGIVSVHNSAQAVELAQATAPEMLSGDWRTISSDIRLKVYTDRHGVRRATLFLLTGEKWEPVAIDGLTELGPPVFPSR